MAANQWCSDSRADEGVILTESEPRQVEIWEDASGLGTAAYAAPAQGPTVSSQVLNGWPAIDFGGDQGLVLEEGLELNTFSIFVVGRSRATSGPSGMILGPVTVGVQPQDAQLRWQDETSILITGSMAPTRIVTGDTRDFHLLALIYDGEVLSVYRDGITVAELALATDESWRFGLIGRWFRSYYLDGQLAELLAYERSIEPVEQAIVSDYFLQKYGLGEAN